MKYTNLLPQLRTLLQKWQTLPTEAEFEKEYLKPHEEPLQGLLYDFGRRGRDGLYAHVKTIDWNAYRNRVLETVDPEATQKFVAEKVALVEKTLGVKLNQEIILFGAFDMMDGYARFHNGQHQLYLGMDAEFADDQARSILVTHEITHLAREGNPEVWDAHGIPFVMHHDEMTERQPTIEHLFDEGFACLVSEILNPGAPAGTYVYLNGETYPQAVQNRASIDEVVHKKITSGKYFDLYDPEEYAPGTPRFSHYFWAWQWLRELHFKEKIPLTTLVKIGSKDLIPDALAFHIQN